MSTDHAKGTVMKNAKPGRSVSVKRAKKQPGPKKKASRKQQSPTANDLMLKAWEYTYATRDKRVD